MTSNPVEGVNYLIKQIQAWRTLPTDAICNGLNRLALYNVKELNRAENGQGIWTSRFPIKPLYERFQDPSDQLSLSKSLDDKETFEDIISSVKSPEKMMEIEMKKRVYHFLQYYFTSRCI